mgnify:CR=1 FL=1
MVYKESYECLLYEKKGHIGYITINNPRQLNALNASVLNSLDEIFDDILEDREVWGVILTGIGRSFVAGADIGDGVDTFMSPKPEPKRKHFIYVDGIYNKIAEFDRPIIAAINGYALGGGCELALCCDIRIASSTAKIGFPESGLGGIPAYGGPTRLPRIIGMNHAKEMLLIGDNFSAEDCYKMGLLTKVVEPDKLMEEAEAIMVKIISKGPIAIKYVKMLLNKGAEMSYLASLETERLINGVLSITEDYHEGLDAFHNKRKADFKND